MMLEGKCQISDDYVAYWKQDDDKTLNMYIIPTDPAGTVFHTVLYPSGEGGYTKYDQEAQPVKEAVAVLVDERLLPTEYVDDVVIAKETKEEEYRAQRIIELEAELAVLKDEALTPKRR